MAKRKAAESPASTATFEESLIELQAIVADLEEGSLGLESSLARFERGIGLLRACYIILDSAEQKIEILAQSDATSSKLNETGNPAKTKPEVPGEQVANSHRSMNLSERTEDLTVELVEYRAGDELPKFEEPSLF